jgi:hypothetical protein
MNIEDWHREYGELARDRDAQARYCARLKMELQGELNKLASLERALMTMRRAEPTCG